jgi:hypothetical protein
MTFKVGGRRQEEMARTNRASVRANMDEIEMAIFSINSI